MKTLTLKVWKTGTGLVVTIPAEEIRSREIDRGDLIQLEIREVIKMGKINPKVDMKEVEKSFSKALGSLPYKENNKPFSKVKDHLGISWLK